MSKEFVFLDSSAQQSDVDLLFGCFDDNDVVCTIGEGWSLAHVMHSADIFPSVGQAKKNGWDKPIPPGFEEFVVTKRKIKIFTFIPID